MSDKERPLPEPKSSPFGLRRNISPGQESPDPALGDMMAMAMANGKLDEFLDKKFKENPHARELAMMMMGMSGMADITGPDTDVPKCAPDTPEETEGSAPEEGTEIPQDTEIPLDTEAPEVPKEVMEAIKDGNVEQLKAVLRKEHAKRSGTPVEEGREAPDAPEAGPTMKSGEDASQMERAVLEKLFKIASENNVTMDWVMARALKLYVRDYEHTGRI